MTDHRDRIIEAMARAICWKNGMDPNLTLGGDGQNFLWHEYISETEAALDALTTGPLFEEMVELAQKAYALKAADPEPGFSGLMDAALREALGAREA